MLDDDRMGMLAYRAGLTKAIELSKAGNQDSTRTLIQSELTPLAEKLAAALDAHVQYNYDIAKHEELSSSSFAAPPLARLLSRPSWRDSSRSA